MSDPQPRPEAPPVRASIDIDAPSSRVWEVLADFNAMYTWAPSIEDTEGLSEVERGVGAARRNTAKGFGAIDQTVTAWVEGEGFTYTSGPLGPFAGTLTSYRLRADGELASECSLELSYELRSGGAPGQGPSEAQLRAKLEAGLREILEALEVRVETGELVRPYKDGAEDHQAGA